MGHNARQMDLAYALAHTVTNAVSDALGNADADADTRPDAPGHVRPAAVEYLPRLADAHSQRVALAASSAVLDYSALSRNDDPTAGRTRNRCRAIRRIGAARTYAAADANGGRYRYVNCLHELDVDRSAASFEDLDANRMLGALKPERDHFPAGVEVLDLNPVQPVRHRWRNHLDLLIVT